MKLLKNIAISTSLCLATLTSVQAISFHDTENHWGKPYINQVVEVGMMSGIGDNLFAPEQPMSMGEFAVVIVNGAFDGEKSPSAEDNHWADPYLNVLLSHGLLENNQGDSIVTMEEGWESQAILRHQVVSVVARLMTEDYANAALNHAITYTDIIEDSQFTLSLQDFANVVRYGVMAGVSDTVFGVNDSFTRAAACVVIENLLNLELLTPLNASEPEIPTEPETPTEPEVPEIPQEPEIPVTPAKPLVILPADSNQDGILTVAEINVIFDQFKEEYPQGTRWTNDNSYYSSALRITGYGCAGWAFMLSDAIFGTQPRYTITRDQLQVGDFWHTGSHFGVIMEVGNGYYITTEGNFNSSIYWDYKRTTSYLTDNVTYYSRYPR